MKDKSKVAIGLGLAGAGALLLLAKKAKVVPPVPPVEPVGDLGDVDLDGYVTEADVKMVSLYLTEQIALTTEQLRRADVNGDEEVTISDVLLIGRYLAGQIDTFPAGAPAPRLPPPLPEPPPTPAPPAVIPEPSKLMVEYQVVLDEAHTYVDQDAPDSWVTIPGYGLQYAYLAIPLLEGYMIEEAIRYGAIKSATEVYFLRDIMYHISADTIVPYWWRCPYCPERFRSPAKLEEHTRDKHGPPIKGKITAMIPDWEVEPYDPDLITGIKGLTVRWRNDATISFEGHIYLYVLDYRDRATYECRATRGQDSLVPPGGTADVYFPSQRQGTYYATLVCFGVGDLDRATFDTGWH